MSIICAIAGITLPAAITLAAANNDQHSTPPNITQSRQVWAQATQGDNLALGKKLLFSQKPGYRPTTDANDPLDLTDGKLADRPNDTIWRSKDTVGWTHADEGVNLLIDLGNTQPVGTVVARFLGGGEGVFLFPAEITIVGSDDGKTFFQLASLHKVKVGEKELAEQNPDQYFYIPENRPARVHTFILPVHRKTRYVGLHLKGESSFILTDQIAVMKDPHPSQASALNDLPARQFIIHGIAIHPRQKNLVVTTNIQTPNHFYITDVRNPSARKKPVKFILDLPEGLSIIQTDNGEAHRDESAKDKNRWILENFYNVKTGKSGSVWLALDNGATLDQDAVAVFSSDDPDSQANTITAPVKTAVIPVVGNDHLLDVSLAWMLRDEERRFINFFDAFHHMGFNMVATFPRNAATPEDKKELVEFVEKSRKAGFRILYNESAFHVMQWHHGKEAEIYNQIDGKKGRYPCPCYTGTYYQQELQRIGDNAGRIHPDEIFYDIELWYKGVLEAKKCSRCQAAFKKSGMTNWNQFIYAQGTRQMRDLQNATAGTTPDGKNPVSGLYNSSTRIPYYQHIFDFSEIYPKYIQLAMPAQYVHGDAQIVHNTIRGNYDKIHTRNIIPWMTAGTYGEFPPYKLQQMILESFLNGAKGITYYAYGTFDPMDWYYHANALKLLVPYQQILTNGKQVKVVGDNEFLTYSAFGTDKQALVLIGNYAKTPHGRTHLNFPGREVSSVKDAISNQELSVKDLEDLQVKPDQQRLLSVRFR